MNTLRAIESAQHHRPPTLPDTREEPPHPTFEHDEIGIEDGGADQRSPEPRAGRSADPGAIYYHLPNAYQPQRLAAIPTYNSDRGRSVSQLAYVNRRISTSSHRQYIKVEDTFQAAFLLDSQT